MVAREFDNFTVSKKVSLVGLRINGYFILKPGDFIKGFSYVLL